MKLASFKEVEELNNKLRANDYFLKHLERPAELAVILNHSEDLVIDFEPSGEDGKVILDMLRRIATKERAEIVARLTALGVEP